MPLNKVKGNMYDWCDYTWNPIRGRCPHQCSYCYMRIYPVGKLRFEMEELNTNLKKDRVIFVGSSTDMFAKEVTTGWIEAVLCHCRNHPDNQYLFQSKNPSRFLDFERQFPTDVILGTTIETNRDTCDFSQAPKPLDRFLSILEIGYYGFDTMISIEPVVDFDCDVLVNWIKGIKPGFVSIGADSKGHGLPEPSPEKVRELVARIEKFTEVRIKPNLARLGVIGDGI